MKLGSIIGLVICCILLITGGILCAAGYVSARNSGQYLFTQTNENGTFFVGDIDDGSTTTIKLGVSDAKIKIIGGADKSKIEFLNYNPNYYVLSSTAKVINFEEVESFSSMLKIWENGFSFKGLRYIFDFNDYGSAERPKEIHIYVTDISSLSTIDIDAVNAEISFENVDLSGDITIRTETGSVDLSNVSCGKFISVHGTDLNASLKGVVCEQLSLSAESSDIYAENSSFTSAEITVSDGRVDFYSPVSFDNGKLSIVSETGGILLNGSPVTGAYSIDSETPERTLRIKTVSAGINMEYPQTGENSIETPDASA